MFESALSCFCFYFLLLSTLVEVCIEKMRKLSFIYYSFVDTSVTIEYNASSSIFLSFIFVTMCVCVCVFENSAVIRKYVLLLLTLLAGSKLSRHSHGSSTVSFFFSFFSYQL